MKHKDKQQLHQSSTPELSKKLTSLQKKLAEVHLNITAGKEKNLHAGTNIRHQIAIIKSLINQKKGVTK